MKRLDTAGLLALGEGLTKRERRLLSDVHKLGLMSHVQLAALLNVDSASEASAASSARAVRRTLKRLTDLGLLARLQRRVGGLRAGSAGFVYYLGPAGQRLIAYWDGRGLVRGRYRPEPGGRYVRHRLAGSQLYVDVRLAAQRSELDLLDFQAEPDCWRSYLDGMGGERLLKPDAFVRLGIGAYEERCFVEVDLGTESRPVIARKLRAYLDYFLAGTEQAVSGVFPRVVLLANSDERKDALVEVCGRLPAESWQLFTVGLLADGLRHLSGEAAEVTS